MTSTLEKLSREDLEAEVLALRAQGQSSARKARRDAIFQSTIDYAIIATDLNGVITDWNKAAHSIMGWTAQEMVGGTAEAIFTSEDRAVGRMETEMALALKDGRANDERWHLRKDGTRFFALGEMFVLKDEDDSAQGFVKVLRDRTEQRRTYDQLQQNEEWLRTIVDAVETAFAIVEVKFDENDHPIDYRFLQANPAFEQQAGVNLRGKWVTEFAPDLEKFWFETYGHVARTGEPANFESYAKAFSRWFDVRALRVGDPAARQIAIFFNDVTARREDEARRNSIQQLSDRIRDLSDPTEIARAAQEILGVALDANVVAYGNVSAEADVVVESYWASKELSLPSGPISISDYGLYDQDLKRGEPVVICDVARNQRTEGFAEALQGRGIRSFVSVPLIEQSKLVALLYVGQSEPRNWSDGEIEFIRDVAERVRAEAERSRRELELRESETRVKEYADRVKLALAAGAIIGTWVWDIPNDRFTVDEAFATAFGLDPSLGRTGIPLAQIVDTVHPDDQAGLAAAIQEAIARGGAYAHQYRTRRADGKYYWLEANGRVDLGPDGKAANFPGVLLDVDARRAVEAERDRVTGMLRSLNDNLEQRVLERTSELMRAEEALRQSQKMEAVGQLTGGLAHDFNNLLAGISGSLELIETRIQQGRLMEVEKYVVAAQGATKRAAALTHRLLAFSRRQTLEPKPTDVVALIDGMEELVRRTVGPQIHIETHAGADLWATLVDPNQLENAVLNLCINARDAMPDGGRIIIEANNRKLDEDAVSLDLDPGDYVSVSVSDSGVGIPADVIERVFEPFFTTKPIGVGTGLGLSMIFGFAKQSGGQVRVQSEVGKGTTVTLFLPRHDGVKAADETVESGILSDHKSDKQMTVLVVDDEPLVRMLIVDVLEELGYRPIEADDGPAGMELIRSTEQIDLLITDVGLPGGMNGRQVADAARELRPGLKVLFVTGYAENAVINHGHLDPGMEIITKPFDLTVLAKRIGDMLNSAAPAPGS
ncbi:PAS domain S-box protein [Agrobacterium larrymoorei]|uniref:histidine kinase n=1 Tax=Agrobacterium larrymoorei TaxID=160699 RepID=A0ABX8TBD5_9HYPH|nr:PAS domain S-box protein [Agrobacterium larrymoorei]QYA10573.1 PAS domain S-box protein [Agrobacterium larrymoorei]